MYLEQAFIKPKILTRHIVFHRVPQFAFFVISYLNKRKKILYTNLIQFGLYEKNCGVQIL